MAGEIGFADALVGFAGPRSKSAAPTEVGPPFRSRVEGTRGGLSHDRCRAEADVEIRGASCP